MIPLLGVPMIKWNLTRFLEFGVDRFYINLHYLPDVLTGYLGDGSRFGATISYYYEPQILGTAGGLKSFKDQLEDDFFVIYGDIFCQLDYHAMEKAWRNYNGALGMQRVRLTDNYLDADIVELDESKRVIAVHAKPHSAIYSKAYRMSGIFILNRKILSVVPRGVYSEIGRDMIPAVVGSGGDFRGYICDDYSKGIDTVGKKGEVELYLRQHGLIQCANCSSPDGRKF